MLTCPKCFCQTRYHTAFLAFLAIVTSYMMRVDINIALLSMVNDTIDHALQNGEHSWDRVTQGMILGAFYWGYILTQIPGGILAHKYGPKWITLIGIVGCAFLHFFIPKAASLGSNYLITIRALQGCLQAVVFPSVGCLLGLWAPASERTRMGSLLSFGGQVGTVMSQMLAGLISHPILMDFDPVTHIPRYKSHWPYVFYIFGTINMLFGILWIVFVYNGPQHHPWIGKVEKEFLLDAIYATKQDKSDSPVEENSYNWDKEKGSEKLKDNSFETDSTLSMLDEKNDEWKPSVPWLAIIRSRAVWSILICHIAFNWGWYTLITNMPNYLYRVLGFNIASNGILSSIPYVIQIICTVCIAYLSDKIIIHGWIKITWVRKINNLIALVGLGLGLLSVGLIGCNSYIAIAFLAMTMGIMGWASSGFFVNPLDLAPLYAGNIISLTNTFATLPGIFGPLFVGYMTQYGSDIRNWLVVFVSVALFAWFCGLMNLFMTDGELQSWAVIKNDQRQRNPKAEILPIN